MSTKPLIILGGGLWGGLLASRLQQLYPEVEYLLIEEQASFGGNHTWCFHEKDVSEKSLTWLSPFMMNSWDGYTVKFPTYEKTIRSSYHALSSQIFHQVLMRVLPQDRYRLSTKLSLDEALSKGSWVIDARGKFLLDEMAYQKFVGLELELDAPHGLLHPILMDVQVPQIDGFRFIYSLPFSPTRLLIEDTRYSLSPEINDSELKQSIINYSEERGWRIKKILRMERGILPLPLSEVTFKESEAVQLGGLFHDTTGYSLPDAVRLIERLLEKRPSRENFQKVVENYRHERLSDRSFFRLLNRFMFRASSDADRYRMLEFFYRHSPQLISQFYSGELSTFEKLRFFLGRPPVSIISAIREAII